MPDLACEALLPTNWHFLNRRGPRVIRAIRSCGALTEVIRDENSVRIGCLNSYQKASTMATAVATKSAPLHQKIKRPPPPAVQTAMNGVRSLQSSPSPSLSSKRPPSSFKQPPTPNSVNGINGAASGAGPRVSNRRRESQRPGDVQLRQFRGGKSAQSDLDQRARSMPQPYGMTESKAYG